jgi:hypothetical protein
LSNIIQRRIPSVGQKEKFQHITAINTYLSVTSETNAPWTAGQICRLHGFPKVEDDRMDDLFEDPCLKNHLTMKTSIK